MSSPEGAGDGFLRALLDGEANERDMWVNTRTVRGKEKRN
jgi:hypothetical protein